MTSDGLTYKLLTNLEVEILINYPSTNTNNPNNTNFINNIIEDNNRIEQTINFSSILRIDSNQLIIEEKSENNYSTCTNSKKY